MNRSICGAKVCCVVQKCGGKGPASTARMPFIMMMTTLHVGWLLAADNAQQPMKWLMQASIRALQQRLAFLHCDRAECRDRMGASVLVLPGGLLREPSTGPGVG